MNNTTHYANFVGSPEDLGRKNGFETAIVALREAREKATEYHSHHNVQAIAARDAMEAGQLKGDTLYKHHAEQRAYFLHKSEALLDAINEMKKLRDNT